MKKNIQFVRFEAGGFEGRLTTQAQSIDSPVIRPAREECELMELRSQVKYGPWAKGGVEILTLRDGRVEVDLQWDSGLEIPGIRCHRPFLGRRVEGGVISGRDIQARTDLASFLETLPAWNDTVIPGYDPKTGLHSGLTGHPSVNNEWWSTTTRRELCVGAKYRVSQGITGNTFGTEVLVDRRVTLGDVGPDTTVLTREDHITALRTCPIGHLVHINPYALAGDRILVRHGSLVCVYDRDGSTPGGQNPLVGFDPNVLHDFHPERCFFTFIRPTDGFGEVRLPVVPLVVLGENGTGLGVTFRFDERLPFTMLWFSPMADAAGQGVFGLEHGSLPLGCTRSAELGLTPKLEPDQPLRRVTSLYFLDSPAKMEWFLAAACIDPDAEYPSEIEPDWEGQFTSAQDYNPETANFDTLRRAAGLLN